MSDLAQRNSGTQSIEWRRVYVDQGTKCVFETADQLRVDAGRVIVDGAMSITHGNVTVNPRGTLVVFEATQGGGSTVTVAEGSAQVQTAAGSTSLSAGQSVSVAADGGIAAPQSVSAAGVVSAVMAGTGSQTATGGQQTGGQPQIPPPAVGAGQPGDQQPGDQQPGDQQPGDQQSGDQQTDEPGALQPVPLAADGAVEKAIICTGLSDRGKPENVLDVYPSDTEKLALYLEIRGAPPNTELELKWQRDGKILGRSLLLVAGDKKSLTYLYAGGRETLWEGNYAVDIEQNDRLIGRVTFRVGQ